MPITYANEVYSDGEVLALLRPYVAEWFKREYGVFTPPQRMSIPIIKRGLNVLISSPTGTGKTLAVFLALLDELYYLHEKGELEKQIYIVYVSPLRALNNDMRRNLLQPIEGISRVARELGYDVPELSVAVRTSDTTPYEKQKMTRNPPHILITTPESLAISLVAPKFREKLKTVRWIVIDEIHELCSSKRGVDLSLSVERLDNLTGGRLVRIGLSATIAPLEEVAKYLVGYNDNGEPRDCVIVDARFTKPHDIRVVCPVVDLVHASAEEINEAIYSTLTELIKKYRTTLVFTNTRSATERVVYKLRKIFESNGIVDADQVEAHHSSLSREIRLSVEEKLKEGKLRAVVSSTSLELGIDIGSIDLVILLSSPKSVSRLLQRVGRSGHRLHRVSLGRLVVVDRDDLVECTVLAKAAIERRIDRVKIPRNALDVLAQHIIAMSLEGKWKVSEAYKLVKRSYCYHNLSYEDFISVLRYLSGKYGELESMKVYAKIWFDEEEGVFGRKRRSKVRMIYYMNSGTIPDEAKIKVFTEDGRYIGELDEQFYQILTPGDIFVLGGRTYEYLYGYGSYAIVKPVKGVRPTVPSWFSEMLPLAYDSALLVGRFRRIVSEKILSESKSKVIEWLVREYNLEPHAAENIYQYFYEQLMFMDGIVPSDKSIVIELFEEGDKLNIIFHTLYGRRTNDALSRAYAYILSRMKGVSVRITVTDNGFMLTIPRIPLSKSDVEKLVESVKPGNIRSILEKAIEHTELLRRRFRHCAVRSFMLLRRYMDREKSVHKLQLSAENLLNIVKELKDFPILKEAYREILEDFMDIQHAIEVLTKIDRGEIEVTIVGPNSIPSPFAHNIVVYGYSDIVLMEDRRRLLQKLHEQVINYLKYKSKSGTSLSRSLHN